MSGAAPEAQTPTHAVVPLPVMQALAQYLQKRPWEEANEFLVELSRCPMVAMQEAPDTPPTAEQPESSPPAVAPKVLARPRK